MVTRIAIGVDGSFSRRIASRCNSACWSASVETVLENSCAERWLYVEAEPTGGAGASEADTAAQKTQQASAAANRPAWRKGLRAASTLVRRGFIAVAPEGVHRGQGAMGDRSAPARARLRCATRASQPCRVPSPTATCGPRAGKARRGSPPSLPPRPASLARMGRSALTVSTHLSRRRARRVGSRDGARAPRPPTRTAETGGPVSAVGGLFQEGWTCERAAKRSAAEGAPVQSEPSPTTRSRTNVPTARPSERPLSLSKRKWMPP